MSEASKRTRLSAPPNKRKVTRPSMPQRPQLWVAQDTVAFIVGEEEKKFVIHKHLADSSSTFFKAAFASSFIEGQTQSMRLEDVEAEVFGLLVHWLYTHAIQYTVPNGRKDDAGDQLVMFAKLWTLGGRFLIGALQNELIPLLQTHLLKASTDALKAFFEYAQEPEVDTPLKDLAVSTMAFVVPITTLRSHASSLPNNMLLELVMAMKHHELEKERLENRNKPVKSLPEARWYFVRDHMV